MAGAAVQDAAASAAQAARASVRSRTRARRYRHAGTACLPRPPPPARPPRRIYSASFLPTAGELRESFPSCPFRIMSFSEELAIVASRDFRLISSPSVRVRGPGALRGRVWPGPFDPRAPLPCQSMRVEAGAVNIQPQILVRNGIRVWYRPLVSFRTRICSVMLNKRQ